MNDSDNPAPVPKMSPEILAIEVQRRISAARDRVALDYARRGKEPMHFSETMELRKIHAKRRYEAIYGRPGSKPDPQP